MPERRNRVSADLTPEGRKQFEKRAGNHNLTVGIYARTLLESRLPEALDLLSETGFYITVTKPTGEEVLKMPAALFRTFMEGDLDVVRHFITRDPTRP